MRLSEGGSLVWRSLGRHPLIASAVFVALAGTIPPLRVGIGLLLAAAPQTRPALPFLVSQLVTATIVLTVVVALGWSSAVGLRARPRVDRIIIALAALQLIAVATVLLLPGSSSTGVTLLPVDVLVIAFLAVAGAITEEVAYRGVLLSALTVRGETSAAVWSTAAFALAHLANELSNPLLGVLRGVHALGMGALLAAIRVRSGSLWPGIVVHAVSDMLALAGAIVWYVSGTVALVAILFFVIVSYRVGIAVISGGRQEPALPPVSTALG